jgi:hypothetical protein
MNECKKPRKTAFLLSFVLHNSFQSYENAFEKSLWIKFQQIRTLSLIFHKISGKSDLRFFTAVKMNENKNFSMFLKDKIPKKSFKLHVSMAQVSFSFILTAIIGQSCQLYRRNFTRNSVFIVGNSFQYSCGFIKCCITQTH